MISCAIQQFDCARRVGHRRDGAWSDGSSVEVFEVLQLDAVVVVRVVLVVVSVLMQR